MSFSYDSVLYYCRVLVRFDVRESVDVSDNELFEEIEEDEDVSEDNFESEPVVW